MPLNTGIDETAEHLKSDKQEFLWEQFDAYISKNTVTSYERQLLRKWVNDGHSVCENPGSRYFTEGYPPQDFVEAYREDKKTAQLLKGKSQKEKGDFLKDYTGYEETAKRPAPTAKEIKNHVKKLEHELFYLWEYVCSENLWSEANEYLKEHEDEPIPFEYPE